MRTIKHNKVELPDYEEIFVHAIGDLHIGHMNCDMKYIADMLASIPKETNHRIILMGDLLDCGTKDSVGASAYEQFLNPNEQLNLLVKIFEPFAEQIDGVVMGNHEYRILKTSGVDICDQFCLRLDIPYHLYSGVITYVFGADRSERRAYNINFFHGKAGGGVENALRACKTMSQKVFVDAYLMGHCHYKAYTEREIKCVTRNGLLKQMKQKFILTGHTLNYDDSYADQANLEISPKGYPVLVLSGSGEKNINIL